MGYPRFCRTHPTYELKRAPRSECKACWRAYRMKRRADRALSLGADTLMRLYRAVDIRVDAHWKGGIGSVTGIRIDVVKTAPTDRSGA